MSGGKEKGIRMVAGADFSTLIFNTENVSTCFYSLSFLQLTPKL